MPVAPTRELTSVRVDVWTWGVRIYPTRTAATTACRGGHVKVNGVRVKPAHPVRPGDTVRALTAGGERIVVVVALTDKRTSASIAVQNYEDQTPPADVQPRELTTGARDRGTGRPTKRDRRQVERLRGRA